MDYDIGKQFEVLQAKLDYVCAWIQKQEEKTKAKPKVPIEETEEKPVKATKKTVKKEPEDLDEEEDDDLDADEDDE